MNGEYSPCPMCHRTNIHVAEWYDDDGDSTYYCICDDCGYRDPDDFEEEYVAVDHWNRRVVLGYIDGDDPTNTEYDNIGERSNTNSDDIEADDDFTPIKWSE